MKKEMEMSEKILAEDPVEDTEVCHNCRERLIKILAIQRETRNLLAGVVGPLIQAQPEEAEPLGALAEVECDLRSVERHAGLLFDMVTSLHDRV